MEHEPTAGRTPEALILFSGGMDSFLTACRTVGLERKRARLVSFNNSAVLGEENLQHGARRLMNRFGEEMVSYEGVYNTGAVVRRLETYWYDTPQAVIARSYPALTNAQVTCLHCQTAMWISAIAYANARDIPEILAGYRKTDAFCTGHTGYIAKIKGLAEAYGRTVRLPAWDDDRWSRDHGYGRKLEIEQWGFMPAVLEPKCMLGRPAPSVNGNTAMWSDMDRYVEDILVPMAQSEVDELTGIFGARPDILSEQSITVIEYPVPDGKDGFY